MTAVSKVADIAFTGLNGNPEWMSASAGSAGIKRALTADLKECRLSRAEVAIQLSHLIGRTITEAQIDAWAADSKQGHRFPAEMVSAWVRVTGSRRVLDVMCAETGLHVADETERGMADVGRLQIERERADEKLRLAKEKMWHQR